ncbi:hypothetical protein BE20_14200, partial [Sorangium cellulosum]
MLRGFRSLGERSTVRHPLRAGSLLAALAASAGCSDTTAPAAAEALSERFPAVAARVLDGGEALVERGAGFALPEGPAAGLLTVELPGDAGQAIRFRLPGAGGCDGPAAACPGALDIRVREAGARGKGTRAGRAIAYPLPGGTSFWTAASGVAEEWLLLEPGAVQRGAPVATWQIEGASLRKAGEVVLVVDETGAPRLRVTAPEAFADGGKRPVEARLSVEGATLALHVDAAGEAVLVDPVWEQVPTGMSAARREHTATLITSGSRAGQVLVTGGYNGAIALSSAELYDPVTNAWSPAAAMSTARYQHTATLLSDGRRVLVVGGRDATYYVGTAQIYDSDTNTWTNAESIRSRAFHTATLLGDGDVLVAGGYNGSVVDEALRYDPERGVWSTAGTMSGRYSHSAVRLLDGSVLVAGGYGAATYLATAETYDPVGNAWSAAGNLGTARRLHSATLLPNGDVLVAGGTNGTHLASAERYSPTARTWSPAGTMPGARSSHAALLLPSGGQVLVAGGFDGSAYLETTARYDPNAAPSAAWTADDVMATARGSHTLVALANGQLLAAGGRNTAVALSSAELYRIESPNGASCLADGECLSGHCVDGVCCNTACGGGSPGDCQACSAAAGASTNGVCGPRGSGSLCRGSAGLCDVEERCNGSSVDCPADALASATTVCRAAADLCDVAETCTGRSVDCPANAFASRTTVCRAAADLCDVAETCALAPATTVCRPATDLCDVAETCTFAPATTVCRAAGDVCDVAETCTGSAAACPLNAFAPATTVCRPAADVCDAAERCTGSSAACPANAFAPATTVCRTAAGPCDLAETCTGAAAACPADALAAPDTVCAPGACVDATSSVPPSRCTADGACVERAAVACGLYVCDDDACLTRCSTHEDCAAGAYCAPPTCATKKPLDAPCGATVECAEGTCIGGVCSRDRDGDGIVDASDRCPDTPSTANLDTDGDGKGDACDDDDDGDGKPDRDDACPTIADPDSTSDRACSCDPPKQDGDPCDDGNPCTQIDACQGGRCVGSDPFACPQPDPSTCKSAICVAPNGACVERNKLEGAPCTGGICVAGGCLLDDPPGSGGAGGGPSGSGGGTGGSGGGTGG